MKEGTAPIVLRNIPLPVRRALKVKAAREGKSMQGIVLELLERHLVREIEEIEDREKRGIV